MGFIWLFACLLQADYFRLIIFFYINPCNYTYCCFVALYKTVNSLYGNFFVFLLYLAYIKLLYALALYQKADRENLFPEVSAFLTWLFSELPSFWPRSHSKQTILLISVFFSVLAGLMDTYLTIAFLVQALGLGSVWVMQ